MSGLGCIFGYKRVQTEIVFAIDGQSGENGYKWISAATRSGTSRSRLKS
jgi:hypothetical protein